MLWVCVATVCGQNEAMMGVRAMRTASPGKQNVTSLTATAGGGAAGDGDGDGGAGGWSEW